MGANSCKFLEWVVALLVSGVTQLKGVRGRVTSPVINNY